MNAVNAGSVIETQSFPARSGPAVHLVDTTMFFCAYGGGVKRYLKAKQAWFRRVRSVRHSLVVPPQSNADEDVSECHAAYIPLPGGYCFPLDGRVWRDQLVALKPHLIEAGDPYVPGWSAVHAGQHLGIPTVAFFHSDLPRMLQQRAGSWIRPIARHYLRHLYREFDSVLAPSHTTLSQLREWGIARAVLQPMGVDMEIFHPNKRSDVLREHLSLAAETRLLIYAGRFSREKNLHVLEEAVKRLGHPYHLLLVGGGTTGRRTSHVTVLPYEADSCRLATLLASADAFVHAGDQETFGLVAVEALACGLPAVVVEGGALPELVDDSVGVTAPRPTASDMAAAITALFTRDMDRVRIAARKRAVDHFSWATAFAHLTRHYARLLGRSALAHGALIHALP